MDNLPNEVYHRIFDHLRRPEIQTCSLVCKRLNVVATQVYGKKLIIDNEKVQNAKIYLARDTANKYFKHGHLVRKLIFKSMTESMWINPQRTPSDISTVFLLDEFLSLLKYLPNIEEIDFTKSNDYTTYISYLRDASLQHIKKISGLRCKRYSCQNGSYKNYLSTCFRYRGTLTSLTLEYTKDTKGYIFHGVGVLDMLSQFKNLKKLVFNNSCSDNEIMFQIQAICPQLTELAFNSKYEGSLKAVDQKTEAVVKPNKNLQHLNIISLSLSIDYTKYLTSFIEDGLSTVNIQVTTTRLYDWVETVGIENGLKLMTKLGRLNDVNISFTRIYKTRKIYMFNTSKMTRWFQLVNAFKGSKKAFCDVTFCGSARMQNTFEYDTLNNQLSLVHGFDDAEDYDDKEPILLKFTLPDKSIATIGPEIINRLELRISSVWVDFNILNFLEYGFKNCINLQCLEVESYLVIQGCTEEKIGAIDDIQNNLNMVHFQSGAPTTDVLDMLYTYLPDIEYLIFGSADSNYTMRLDLTPFKSLKRCYFILQQDSMDKSASINFEYQDGKEKWYYYDGKSKEFSVVQDKLTFGYYCQSFTFLCNNNDIEFTVCSNSNYSLLNFNMDKLPDTCYHIPK
ncbi:hypothetical protein EDC94DRAFT_659618 [Helicostylum pulchrum]|nr:hypothetical protein EDC94DRAFT_659618 [Helicostylum pulchrum]